MAPVANELNSTRVIVTLGALQLQIVALKLAGVVGWPWWLVLTPSWMVATAFIIVGGILLLVVANDNRRRRAKRRA